jgi:hypothetical protein
MTRTEKEEWLVGILCGLSYFFGAMIERRRWLR